jgi:hypothetical protein
MVRSVNVDGFEDKCYRIEDDGYIRSAMVLMMTMRKGWLADRGTNSEASPSTLAICDAIIYA